MPPHRVPPPSVSPSRSTPLSLLLCIGIEGNVPSLASILKRWRRRWGCRWDRHFSFGSKSRGMELRRARPTSFVSKLRGTVLLASISRDLRMEEGMHVPQNRGKQERRGGRGVCHPGVKIGVDDARGGASLILVSKSRETLVEERRPPVVEIESDSVDLKGMEVGSPLLLRVGIEGNRC